MPRHAPTLSDMRQTDDVRAAAALSVAYIMAITGRVLHTVPLDILDLLLVAAVASSNAAGSEPSPARHIPARTRRSEPVGIGISRNAISRALNVPLETVRRRVAALLAKKVLLEQPGGLVLASGNPIGLGNNRDLDAFNLEMLRRLFRGLKANGIKLD